MFFWGPAVYNCKGREARKMDQVSIGRFIAQCRKAGGLTQRQLADELGISDKTVSKWECGVSLR